jgi:hypothetical protein
MRRQPLSAKADGSLLDCVAILAMTHIQKVFGITGGDRDAI